MIYPSVDQLSKDVYNRYELVIATAKAARIITDMQIKQKEDEEKGTGPKEIREQKEYREFQERVGLRAKSDPNNEKPVKIAIRKIYEGDFVIVL